MARIESSSKEIAWTSSKWDWHLFKFTREKFNFCSSILQNEHSKGYLLWDLFILCLKFVIKLNFVGLSTKLIWSRKWILLVTQWTFFMCPTKSLSSKVTVSVQKMQKKALSNLNGLIAWTTSKTLTNSAKNHYKITFENNGLRKG